MRYLADRGYPLGTAVRFVSDHHRLPEEKRFVLTRVVVPREAARSRRRKVLSVEALRSREVAVDGYNILITTESLLAGVPVYRCDDGFLRDIRGVFRSYRSSGLTGLALCEVLDLLKDAARVEFLLDQQMSKSGELAGSVREMMAEVDIPGTAETARDVDRRLKACRSVVATADGTIIDAVSSVVDLPGEVARRLGIGAVVV